MVFLKTVSKKLHLKFLSHKVETLQTTLLSVNGIATLVVGSYKEKYTEVFDEFFLQQRLHMHV